MEYYHLRSRALPPAAMPVGVALARRNIRHGAWRQLVGVWVVPMVVQALAPLALRAWICTT